MKRGMAKPPSRKSKIAHGQGPMTHLGVHTLPPMRPKKPPAKR